MSIISINELQIYLGKIIAGTDSEDKYNFLILSVQDLAESICYRKFDATDYTEVQDGTGTSEIYLDQYPINSITSVKFQDELKYHCYAIKSWYSIHCHIHNIPNANNNAN